MTYQEFLQAAFTNYQAQIEINKSNLEGFIGTIQIEEALEAHEQAVEASGVPELTPEQDAEYDRLYALEKKSWNYPTMDAEEYPSAQSFQADDEWFEWLDSSQLKAYQESSL